MASDGSGGCKVRCTGSRAWPSHPSRGFENAAPKVPPTSLGGFDPPSASTRVNDVPSRRRLTPSGSPVMTRSPTPSGVAGLAQAMLRDGPVGSGSGSSWLHGCVPAGAPTGSWHQLASTWPLSASPSGLKNIVVEADASCAFAVDPDAFARDREDLGLDRRRLAGARDGERLRCASGDGHRERFAGRRPRCRGGATGCQLGPFGPVEAGGETARRRRGGSESWRPAAPAARRSTASSRRSRAPGSLFRWPAGISIGSRVQLAAVPVQDPVLDAAAPFVGGHHQRPRAARLLRAGRSAARGRRRTASRHASAAALPLPRGLLAPAAGVPGRSPGRQPPRLRTSTTFSRPLELDCPGCGGAGTVPTSTPSAVRGHLSRRAGSSSTTGALSARRAGSPRAADRRRRAARDRATSRLLRHSARAPSWRRRPGRLRRCPMSRRAPRAGRRRSSSL